MAAKKKIAPKRKRVRFKRRDLERAIDRLRSADVLTDHLGDLDTMNEASKFEVIQLLLEACDLISGLSDNLWDRYFTELSVAYENRDLGRKTSSIVRSSH